MDPQAQTTDTTAASTKAVQVNITLETPIQRGSGVIDVVTLRKPLAGALRGINLAELLALRAEAVMLLLPRISTPTLTREDVAGMDPVDFVACATEVVNFLVPSRQLETAKANQAMAMESLSV
ncbi:phage tail assembly protein [Delftia acidovorans]|uniref:phage tail assembly protein n=1 Tax=Delftia acidovorans TaxID=80866 RepID=UPI003018BF0E